MQKPGREITLSGFIVDPEIWKRTPGMMTGIYVPVTLSTQVKCRVKIQGE
jgi:hypothetical protein